MPFLDREMGRPVPKKHDLVILWNRLTDEWKEKVAETSCFPMEDIREALGQYKDAAVTLRYGGPLGEQTTQAPVANTMRKACGGPPETGQHARRPGTPANRASAGGAARTRRLTAYPASVPDKHTLRPSQDTYGSGCIGPNLLIPARAIRCRHCFFPLPGIPGASPTMRKQ